MHTLPFLPSITGGFELAGRLFLEDLQYSKQPPSSQERVTPRLSEIRLQAVSDSLTRESPEAAMNNIVKVTRSRVLIIRMHKLILCKQKVTLRRHIKHDPWKKMDDKS